MDTDTLDGSEWDVVIVGTGVAESLLALSLSRSGQRILHLDPNDYYGGNEAALGLSEAETWTKRHAGETLASSFSHASIIQAESDEAAPHCKLASPRAYSVSLAPHLIYSRSSLISTVISARIHNQLEFQAVGSWFVLDGSMGVGGLVKVPGGREDVFADTALGLKSKRSLMKFLRFVADYEDKTEVWQHKKDTPFPTFLEQKFGLPQASLAPILALTMSEKPPSETPTELALSRIARHARSIGTFGPGFGAVLPKWGGLAEIVQVACRACAVGGGVYVLGKSVESLSRGDGEHPISLELRDGDRVTSKWLASSQTPGLDDQTARSPNEGCEKTSKSISVVSSPLSTLFPPTSEGGVTPAGAVVTIPGTSDHEPPVYVFAHASDAGECPTGQCILYTSVALPHEDGFPRLQQAVAALLENVDGDPSPTVLWSLRFEHTHFSPPGKLANEGQVVLPSLSSSLALEDEILDGVKVAWQQITGEDGEAFMKFEAREGIGEDEE